MDWQLFAWVGFNVFVIVMLIIDLLIFHRTAHTVKFKEAAIVSAIWIMLALVFCLGIYYFRGSEPALNFLAGYLLEKSLSVDNLFVFLLIFSYFRVPSAYQHKVLFWGVLGALVMRAIFIFAGILLIQKFSWIVYLFGAFLIYSGIKFMRKFDEEIHPEKNWILIIFRKFFRITSDYVEDHFFIKKSGIYYATPLFVVLLFIETTDLLFAVDSVPAILAITTDPFIVYTSNVFAILGLRSLYFALAGIMGMFHYLNYGLALLLIFIGCKMILSHHIKIPTVMTLGVIVLVLGSSSAASLIWKKKEK